MVRKIMSFFIFCIFAVCTFSATAKAENFTIYDGNISSTYVTYFKDISSNIGIFDNYVCFRSGQNEYLMIVGDIDYEYGHFSSDQECTKFTITNNTSSYNNHYSYNVVGIDSFSLDAYDYILYSDLGQYPQLLDKGVEYEFQTLFIVITLSLCLFIHSIFEFVLRKRS